MVTHNKYTQNATLLFVILSYSTSCEMPTRPGLRSNNRVYTTRRTAKPTKPGVWFVSFCKDSEVHKSADSLFSFFVLFFFFFVTISRPGCLAEIRWTVCIKNPRDVWVYHSSGRNLGDVRIIIIYSFRVLADVFSQEFEWQQVSSSLQDSSQYSGRSQ